MEGSGSLYSLNEIFTFEAFPNIHSKCLQGCRLYLNYATYLKREISWCARDCVMCPSVWSCGDCYYW